MARTRAIACGRNSPDCLEPAEAFSLVGDETRVRILEALWAIEDTPASFSTVYDAVEVDTSAQFNYHLNQLTGPFVRKTDAGYDLRTAGEHVVRAIVAGSFNAHPTMDPFEIGDDCTRCDRPLVARYQDERVAIDCLGCGLGHGEYGFPPGGLLDRGRDEIVTAFDRLVRHRHSLANDGVCPACNGRVETAIRRDGDCCPGVDVRAVYTCQQCRNALCSTVGLSALDRAPVVAFYRDHGVEVADTPYWQFEWCVSDDQVSVRASDPWRLTISIKTDGDTLELTLDGELELVELTRS